MRRRVILGVGVGVIALIAASAGASALRDAESARPDAAPAGTTLVSGFHEAGEKFDLGGRTVDGGRYTAGYSLEAKLLSPMTDVTLNCMLVDLSGRLTNLRQPAMVVRADGEWTTLGFEDVFELPEVTLSIRCTPSASGDMSASFRDVTITTQKDVLRDRD